MRDVFGEIRGALTHIGDDHCIVHARPHHTPVICYVSADLLGRARTFDGRDVLVWGLIEYGEGRRPLFVRGVTAITPTLRRGGDYRAACGVLAHLCDEPAEDSIRRVRDGAPDEDNLCL